MRALDRNLRRALRRLLARVLPVVLVSLHAGELRASAAQSQEPPAPKPADQHERELLDQAFRSLEEELKAAIQDYQASIRAAQAKGLPHEEWPKNPAPGFYERFEALALQDQPDALRWCIGFIPSAGFPMDEVIARKTVLYDHMVRAHASSRWIADIVQFLSAEGHPAGIGIERAAGFLDAIAKANKELGIRARALWAKGQLFARSDDAAHAPLATRTWREIVACCPATLEGRRAKGLVFQADHLQVGMTAPDMRTVDPDGNAFELSDFRGKITAIVFWGFWSPESQHMLPLQVELVARMKDKPFQLLGVNTDGKKDDFKRLAKERGVTWKQSWQGSRQGPWPEAWGVFRYPTVIVLDEDGVIRAVEGKSWQQAAEVLTGTVEKLLADLETKRRGEQPPK